MKTERKFKDWEGARMERDSRCYLVEVEAWSEAGIAGYMERKGGFKI